MNHQIYASEADLDPRRKFMAREVQWFAPRAGLLTKAWRATLRALYALALLFAGAAFVVQFLKH